MRNARARYCIAAVASVMTPPRAFNPHTTCPMPGKENRSRVPIPAGERDYHKKGHS